MRCRQWNATGGKSDATFSMTHCSRYVLKVVSKSEFKMFTELSSDYFKFMAKATMHGLPTVMNKIAWMLHSVVEKGVWTLVENTVCIRPSQCVLCPFHLAHV